MMCSRASGTLETLLLLAARDQKRTKKQNQDQHAMVLRETEGIIEKINTIDMYIACGG
jgi:hypothetical protein